MSGKDSQRAPTADRAEIRRALSVLFDPGDVVELRAFKTRRCTVSGYYDDLDRLADDAVRVNRQCGGVYVTINPVEPALLARRVNRCEEWVDATTNDLQIVRRQLLPIDLDVGRPTGISSTNEEHDQAIEKARRVYQYLVGELGWPEPVTGDSGNGSHLLPRIDLPNDQESADLVQRCLQALNAKFAAQRDEHDNLLDGEIGVDTGNFNASRIWKLYGTVAGKGDSTPDRPHRLSRLLHVPDKIEIVPVDKVRQLAALAPVEDSGDNHKSNGRSYSGGNGKFDVAAYLREHGIEIRSEGQYNGGRGRGYKWILSRCVWNSDHVDKSAFVIQQDGGKILAGCQHNSCSGKGWHDLRDTVEPGRQRWQDRPRVDETHTQQAGKRGFVDGDSTVEVPPVWQPFPVEALPEPVGSYVKAVAAAIGTDPAYVAVAVLPVLAGAIGNSRQVRLKPGWTEPAVLWSVLIGESGTHKSPVLDTVTRSTRRRQAAAIEAWKTERDQFDRDSAEYKLAYDDWRKSGRKRAEPIPPPEQPQEPVCVRYCCSDTTVEALADRLSDAPRGLLVVRDELAGWLEGFDRYRGGRGGDVAHWLTMHGARDLLVDRKTGDSKILFVPKAAVSVLGGIQPAVLGRALGREHFDNGLAARLLLAMPPRQAKRWSDNEIDDGVEHKLAGLLDALYGLQPHHNEAGQPEPVTIGLSSGGKAAWVEFYNEHAQQQAEATGDFAAVLSKLEGTAARLALLLHLVRSVSGDTTVDQVDEASISSGVAMAQWFANETRRVYAALHETPDQQDRRQAVELIERHGGRITARELRQSMRRFKDSGDEAERFLADLVKAGVGTWEPVETGTQGGRPTRKFRLSTPSTVYETPTKPEETGGFVDVDTVDGDQINRTVDEVEDLDPAVEEWEEITI